MIYEIVELPFTNFDIDYLTSKEWVSNLAKAAGGLDALVEWAKENEPLVQIKRVKLQRRVKLSNSYDKLSIFIFAWDFEEDKTMFMLKYA